MLQIDGDAKASLDQAAAMMAESKAKLRETLNDLLTNPQILATLVKARLTHDRSLLGSLQDYYFDLLDLAKDVPEFATQTTGDNDMFNEGDC